MPNPKTSSQDWFYHAPGQKGTAVAKDLPPASQIPGLGNHDLSNPDEIYQDPHLRRKWIRDTDSEYVKLAKAGGRRDLFQYREYKNSGKGPKGYPRVDWFDHTSPPNDEAGIPNRVARPQMPDWYIHDEYICQEEDFIPAQPKRPLLGFDGLSVWKRNDQETRFNNNKLPLIYKQKLRNTKKIESDIKPVENRLPPICSVNKDDGEMGQLLSMGYQSDWLREQEDRRKKDKETKTEERKKFKEKLDRDQGYINRKKKEIIPEVKPLFKMSKFDNISSRVGSFRT